MPSETIYSVPWASISPRQARTRQAGPSCLSAYYPASTDPFPDPDAADNPFPLAFALASNRRGFYGAFLMDNLQLIEQLVLELSQVRGAQSQLGAATIIPGEGNTGYAE